MIIISLETLRWTTRQLRRKKRDYQKMKPVAIVHDRTIARLPDRINKVRLLFLILSSLTSSVVAVASSIVKSLLSKVGARILKFVKIRIYQKKFSRKTASCMKVEGRGYLPLRHQRHQHFKTERNMQMQIL